jgi:hypothetical protein
VKTKRRWQQAFREMTPAERNENEEPKSHVPTVLKKTLSIPRDKRDIFNASAVISDSWHWIHPHVALT